MGPAGWPTHATPGGRLRSAHHTYAGTGPGERLRCGALRPRTTIYLTQPCRPVFRLTSENALSHELLATTFRGQGQSQPAAPGLPQRGVGPGAPGGLRGRAHVLPAGLPGQSDRRPHPAQHGHRVHQDGAAGRGHPPLQARARAGPDAGRRALRPRVPAAQAGRLARGPSTCATSWRGRPRARCRALGSARGRRAARARRPRRRRSEGLSCASGCCSGSSSCSNAGELATG